SSRRGCSEDHSICTRIRSKIVICFKTLFPVPARPPTLDYAIIRSPENRKEVRCQESLWKETSLRPCNIPEMGCSLCSTTYINYPPSLTDTNRRPCVGQTSPKGILAVSLEGTPHLSPYHSASSESRWNQILGTPLPPKRPVPDR
ncbi:hypothetical protein LEMLEM_LOCUS16990, partial [Lemmus lemmus]